MENMTAVITRSAAYGVPARSQDVSLTDLTSRIKNEYPSLSSTASSVAEFILGNIFHMADEHLLFLVPASLIAQRYIGNTTVNDRELDYQRFAEAITVTQLLLNTIPNFAEYSNDYYLKVSMMAIQILQSVIPDKINLPL